MSATLVKVRVVDTYVFRKIQKGYKFLMLKRAETKIYEHLWQGVAGKIEKGETAWQAAVRELKEETGLTPIRMFIAHHVSTFYEENGDLINLVPVFGIETETKRITLSSEHSEYKWMDFEDAERTLAWNGQKKGIRTVYEMLISNDDRMKWSGIKLK